MRSIARNPQSARCILAALAVLYSAATLSAGTITVTNNADSGPGSLRDAMSAAQQNDIITFADAVRGTIYINASLPPIVTALTIAGPGAKLLTIDATNLPWPDGSWEPVLSINAPGFAISISGL